MVSAIHWIIIVAGVLGMIGSFAGSIWKDKVMIRISVAVALLAWLTSVILCVISCVIS